MYIHSLLDFSKIPGKRRKPAVVQTVSASVKALYFMHKVLFGGLMAVEKWKYTGTITANRRGLPGPGDERVKSRGGLHKLVGCASQDLVRSSEAPSASPIVMIWIPDA